MLSSAFLRSTNGIQLANTAKLPLGKSNIKLNLLRYILFKNHKPSCIRVTISHFFTGLSPTVFKLFNTFDY